MKLDGLKNMRAGVRSLKGICLVFVFLMFISSLTSAEFYFETDKRINPDTSNTSQQRNVAMAVLNYSGTEYLVAVYQDQSVSLRPVITCKVSSNGGVTWSDDVIISTDTNQRNYDPDVYTMGNYIYVVWTMTKSTGKRATMFAYSANGGVTFSTPIEVNPAGTLDENQPQVAADPYGHVYVAWWISQTASSGGGIYLSYSLNNGLTFSSPFRVSTSPGQQPHHFQRSPDLAADDKYLHVVWYSDAEFEFNVHYTRAPVNATMTSLSTSNFEEARILNYDTQQDDSDQTHPKIAAAGGNVVVVWNDFRDENGFNEYMTDKKFSNNQYTQKMWKTLNDNSSVYYTVSHDYGGNFSVGGNKDAKLNIGDSFNQIFPSVAMDPTGRVVFVAWTDLRYNNTDRAAIFGRVSTDSGDTFGTERRISEFYRSSYNALPSVAVSLDGRTVYAAWESNRGHPVNNDIYLGTSLDTNHRPEGVRFQFGSLVQNEFNISFAWEMTHIADFAYYEVHFSTQQGFTPSPSTLYTRIYDQSQTSVMIEGLTPNTTYYATVIVVDTEGLASTNNPLIEARTLKINIPPRLQQRIPDLTFHEDQGDGIGLLNLTGYFWDDYFLGYNYSLYYKVDPPFERQGNITAIVRNNGFGPLVDFSQREANWYGTERFRIIAYDLGKDGVQSGDDLSASSNWFNVTVLPTNDAPVIIEVQDMLGNIRRVTGDEITFAGDVGAQQDSEYELIVRGEDVDGDPITYTVNTTKVTVTPDLEHPTTIVHLSFTPRDEDVGVFLFTLNASDPTGDYDLLQFNITVKNRNDPPHFTEVAGQPLPPNRTVVLEGVEGEPLWFTVKGDDPDIRFGDVLELSSSFSRFYISQIDARTFNVSFTPTNDDALSGTVSADLFLKDKFKTEAVGGPVHVIITVLNKNEPPVIVSPPTAIAVMDMEPPASSGTFNVNESVRFTVEISDPDGDAVTVVWDFGDNSSKEGFTVEHTYRKMGRYIVNITYSDGTVSLYTTMIIRISSDGDDDNDGLWDALEMKFFGDLSHGPDEDFDGDGYTNRDEIGIHLKLTPTSALNEDYWDPTDRKSNPEYVGGDNKPSDNRTGINKGLVIGVISIAIVASVIAGVALFLRARMRKREEEEEKALEKIELKTKEEIEERRRIYGDEIRVGEILKPEGTAVAEEEIDLEGVLYHEAEDEVSIHDLPSLEKKERGEEGLGWVSAAGPVFDEAAPGPYFGEAMELESVEVDEESGVVDWSEVKEEEIEEKVKPEDLLPEGVSADEIEVEVPEEPPISPPPQVPEPPSPPPPPPLTKAKDDESEE